MSIWSALKTPYYLVKNAVDARRERRNREKVLDVLHCWRPQLMTDNQIAVRAGIELEEAILALDQMLQELPVLVGRKMGVDINGNDTWKWWITPDGVTVLEGK